MSRKLPSWAQSRSGRQRPSLTLPGDLVVQAGAALRRRRPRNAPAPVPVSREVGLRAYLAGRHLTLRLLSLRFDIELVGADALTGLRHPFVFGANEQGVLDYQILRLALPSRLRPTMIAPSRALAAAATSSSSPMRRSVPGWWGSSPGSQPGWPASTTSPSSPSGSSALSSSRNC
ncbi:hypothetical protein [Tessaracoccus defluvii]|uniref:Uncharacterized protein n=1 Tax=Tessaracoccus defluvii TaxID=1285901 RepID=A0A7H0H854_9ACTN|nr:hypothetical protein [Tessaracoccus defluvii]QNP56720.1 hypothetical protein H9L22_04920 [Tessaracoccus defluvii]